MQGLTWFRSNQWSKIQLLYIIGYSVISTICCMNNLFLIHFILVICIGFLFYNVNIDLDTETLFRELPSYSSNQHVKYNYIQYQSPFYIYCISKISSYVILQLIQLILTLSLLLYSYNYNKEISYITCTPLYILMMIHPSADFIVMYLLIIYKYIVFSFIVLCIATLCKLSTIFYIIYVYPWVIVLYILIFILIKYNIIRSVYLRHLMLRFRPKIFNKFEVKTWRVYNRQLFGDFTLYGYYAVYSLVFYFFPIYFIDIDFLFPSLLTIFFLRNIKYCSLFF